MSSAQKSYVLFPLGEQRFALPAERVTELARQDRLHFFPHRTPLLTGVLLRRGRIIPVCDLAQVLVGPEAPERKFYLLANCRPSQLMAIPVTSQCELANADPLPAHEGSPAYISGMVASREEFIGIVDVEKLLEQEAAR